MKVTCPHCAASFNVDESKIPPAGVHLRCAKCRQPFLATRPIDEAVQLPGIESEGFSPVPLPEAPEDDVEEVDEVDEVDEIDVVDEIEDLDEAAIELDGDDGVELLFDTAADDATGTGAPPPTPEVSADAAGLSMEDLFEPFESKSAAVPLDASPLPTTSAASSSAMEDLFGAPGTQDAGPSFDFQPETSPAPSLVEDDLFGPSSSNLIGATPEPDLALDAAAADDLFASDPEGGAEDVSSLFDSSDQLSSTFDLGAGVEAKKPSAGDNAESASVGDVAEAFLKSLSGSGFGAGADDLFGSDQAKAEAPPPMPLDEPPAPQKSAAEHSSLEIDLMAADSTPGAPPPSLPEEAPETLDVESLFGAPPPPPAEMPPKKMPTKEEAFDFSSMLTFNHHSHEDHADAAAPHASAADALELDLAAVSGGTPARHADDEKLEVLDFIDERGSAEMPAIQSTDGASFYLRRNAEKPRGPFDAPTVIAMITSGQLLGDEEISIDQSRWAPLNSVRAFADAIEQLMASPGDVTFSVDSASQTPKGEQALERIKSRYGDRMAGLSLVANTDDSPRRRLMPLFIALAVLGVILLGGAALGLTSYGPFAIHWLFPSSLQAGTPEHRQYLEAIQAMRDGTWSGLREAQKIADRLVTKNPGLIEPRALYAQIAFQLRHAYGADKDAKADRFLNDLASDEKHASSTDLLKARVANDLLKKSAARRAALEAHVRARPDDREATFLLCDLLAVADDRAGAIKLLEEMIAKDASDARAHRRIGQLKLAEEVPESEWVEAPIEVLVEAKPATSDAKPGDTAATGDDATAKADASPSPDSPATSDAKPGDTAAPSVITAMKKVSPKALEALAAFDKAIAADAKDVESLLAKADILTRTLPRPREALSLLSTIGDASSMDRLCRPDRSRADFLRGLNHVALRQYPEAFAAFDKAMESDPDNAAIPALYGKLLLDQGAYDRSEPLFARAHQAEPNDVHHIDGQVRSFIGLEKYHQAQTILTEAKKAMPKNTRLFLLQGRVYDKLERKADARDNYEQALDDAEVGWEAAFYLGRIHLEQNRLDEAKKAFDQSLAKGEGEALPLVGIGRHALATSDPEAALAAFDRAIQIDDANAEAHFGRAESLAALEKLDESEAAFARADALNGNLPRLQNRYGDLLWRLGKREQAAIAFGKGHALDLHDIDSLWKQGAVYFELKRHDEALESLNAALAAEPGHLEALFTKARVHYERQETPQALQSIRNALERKKDRAEFHFWEGNIHSQARQFTDAVFAWQEAIRLDPTHADAMESLARVFQEQGDFNQAVVFFQKTLQTDDKRQALHFNAAECLFQMNRYQEAIVEYQAMIHFDPTFTKAYFKIGRSYTELNETDSAIKWYKKAVELDKNYADAWMLLGYAYKEKFKNQQAIKAFEAYLRSATNPRDREHIQIEINDLKYDH